MEEKLKKSALVDALLFTAFSCVNVMAAETVPANSQIYKEAKSLSKVPANSKVFKQNININIPCQYLVAIYIKRLLNSDTVI